ncbi:hypothetical protein BCF59_0135 [Mycoplasmopsis mustelae]|uniref:Uncharacterized protein n=1 Tax=Mycoplasmopsis mustelae TaxID=171289 RepID=A0A4R7UEY7_9BACT|nr:hypothetical protein [Mycoplasmopsis mustelae]TDV24185.1 hypothetical protein BCF59_0135 [Mycoplasmopsis mustelae]
MTKKQKHKIIKISLYGFAFTAIATSISAAIAVPTYNLKLVDSFTPEEIKFRAYNKQYIDLKREIGKDKNEKTFIFNLDERKNQMLKNNDLTNEQKFQQFELIINEIKKEINIKEQKKVENYLQNFGQDVKEQTDFMQNFKKQIQEYYAKKIKEMLDNTTQLENIYKILAQLNQIFKNIPAATKKNPNVEKYQQKWNQNKDNLSEIQQIWKEIQAFI